jgi:UDP-N-acetylglucosamine:LPS N-acetylglucosamine transferase
VKGLTPNTARRVPTRSASRSTRSVRRSGGVAPRILVLTSGLGSGHARAADAISQAVRQLEPGAVLRQLDFWSLMNPGVAATIKDKYLELVTHCPELYARLHRLDERTWRRVIENDIAPPPEVLELVELLSRSDGSERRSLTSVAEWALGPYPSDLLFYPTACATFPVTAGERAGSNAALVRLALLKWAFQRLQARMEQRLQQFEPDVVVATQMVPAALVSTLKSSSQRWHALPLIGVLTDFGAHDYWRQAGIDLYCVPHEQLAGRPLARNDAARRKVWPIGAPLMHAFERPPDRAVARARLGIVDSPDHPVVLLLGGGLGLGLEHLVEPLLQRMPQCTVVAMAGQNAEVLQRLQALQREWPQRLLARGWTEHMEHYIAAADLVVGKAGGLTVAEVLACGRPLLVTTSLQGQEAFNVQFLERQRVGRFVAEADLADIVEEWIANPQALAEVQQRAWDAGRRDGARRIAARVLEYAGAPQADWLPGALRRSYE